MPEKDISAFKKTLRLAVSFEGESYRDFSGKSHGSLKISPVVTNWSLSHFGRLYPASFSLFDILCFIALKESCLRVHLSPIIKTGVIDP